MTQPTPKAETFYITLDATTGNGSQRFTAWKERVSFSIVRITIRMEETSSGIVELFKNGGYVHSAPIAPKVVAQGFGLDLHQSEYVDVSLTNGPRGERVEIKYEYVEVPR